VGEAEKRFRSRKLSERGGAAGAERKMGKIDHRRNQLPLFFIHSRRYGEIQTESNIVVAVSGVA